ncbi:MAG: tryptophan-rich sensory protein [Hyphomicrobiales bacterium]|nr:tryptophan-rich sensory protein [Hyphomicrobiales bacterium]
MSDLTDQPKPATRPVVLLLFAIAVVASAGLIGNLATIPNIPVWYAGLNKPGFTPPNWVFGPVWSLLYAMMVLAFWRVLLRRSRWTTAGWRVVGVFLMQMALNAFWSVAFFGMHNPLLGLVVVIALELMIVATIITFKPIDRMAAWLLAPYAVWVGYATALNAAIVGLN